jgi:polyisoprenoid-binding protein YceI
MKQVLLAFSLLSCGCVVAAAPPAPAPAAVQAYTTDQATGELRIVFTQAGARSQGRFQKFSAELGFDSRKAEPRSLTVSIQTTSVDTQDKERDQLLRGAELFDVARFPVATFRSSSINKRVDGSYEVLGKLRIRDVTRDIRLPMALRITKSMITLRGAVKVQRLDFGVGQGDWKSTEWVANEVLVEYSLRLVVAK